MLGGRRAPSEVVGVLLRIQLYSVCLHLSLPVSSVSSQFKKTSYNSIPGKLGPKKQNSSFKVLTSSVLSRSRLYLEYVTFHPNYEEWNKTIFQVNANHLDVPL